MSQPRVGSENYPVVYDYYSQHEPSKAVLWGLHLASAALYHPRVDYADGAKDRIASLLESNHRLFLACNHVNMFDQLVVGAAMLRRPLRPTVGHTVVLAKQPYFGHAVGEESFPKLNPIVRRPLITVSGPLANPVIRRSLDTVGGIPVYREKEKQGWNRDDKILSAHMMFDTVAKHVASGKHVFLFPEGTRNKEDPSRLLKLEGGIGHIVVKCTERELPVDIVPMALWYGEGKTASFRPGLYIGNPVEGPFVTPNKVTRQLSDAMATCLNMARRADLA